VPNYVGKYKGSDLGRLKSLRRKIWGGKVFYYSKDKILKQSINDQGRLKVGLYGDSYDKNVKVHILIAITFLGHVPCGLLRVVDHIVEGNPLDNRLCNLQIITQRKNSSKCKNPKSGFTGVSKESGKYRVRICLNNEKFDLGYFNSAEEASEIREKVVELIEKEEDFSMYIKTNTPISKYKNIHFSNGLYRVRVIKNKKSIINRTFKTLEEAINHLNEYKVTQ